VYLGRPTDAPPDADGADTGSWVAIKVIRPDLADDPEFRARFTRELDATGRVDTPYAAALVGGEADTDQPWIVMEFVAGVSLGNAVQPDEPLPAASVWRLAHDIGSALIAMHRAGIVHREVKPSNVILGTTGAKVIDFGVACAADLAQVTETDPNVGTPSYTAPERAQAGEVSSASDMFSLGVLLYFALSGKLPFGEGESSASAVLFHVVYQEPDLSGLHDIEPSLRNLIVRCLAKDPLERPSAMGLVAMAKAAAIDGLWNDEHAADWPPALSARIWQRTRAAGRAVPEALPNKAASLTAVVPNAAAALVPLTAAVPKASVPEAVPPTPEAAPSGTVRFETARSEAPPHSPKDSGTGLLRQLGDEPSSDPKPGSGRRRNVALASAAATTVVVLGLAGMFLSGNGGGDDAAGNQAGAAGGTVGAAAGLGGASSSGAAASGSASGPASTRSGAGGSAGSTGSAAVDAPGRHASQSPDTNAGRGSPSAGASDPGPPSGSAQPPTPPPSGTPVAPPPPTQTGPNTGCTGWSKQHIGSGTSRTDPSHTANIYSGPYSDCSTVGSAIAHGDKLALWCYIVNATGDTWSYVEDTQRSSYGWIPNTDLTGGVGASDHC
jgi:hypothetical protein